MFYNVLNKYINSFLCDNTWDGSVQTTVNVVGTEQGAEEYDPIHTPAE